MAWLPDDRLSALANQLVDRRRREFRQLVGEQHRIELKHSVRGTLSTPEAQDELRRAIHEPFIRFADGMTGDLLGAVTAPAGTVANDAATWVRKRVESELTVGIQGALDELRNGALFRGKSNAALEDEAATMVADARRRLAIAIGRATRSRRADAPAAADLGSIDELVGLKNRRGFNADMARMFTEASAAEEPLALVRIDVDRFKQVNDRYADHSVGDEALTAIGGVLRACARGKGEAYRVGGDEFVLLLPNHTTAEGAAVAERVRLAVSARPVTSRSLTVSISVGVASYPDHAADAAALQRAADKASYEAKSDGGNLVRVFGIGTHA